MAEPGHDDTVLPVQDLIHVDEVRIVLRPPDRTERRAVVAKPDGLAPGIGAVAVRPVDCLVAEKDNVPSLRRNLDGLQFVWMIPLWR